MQNNAPTSRIDFKTADKR